jgi:hypothetical protein
MPIPRVYANNNEELGRIRAMTAERLREERAQQQAVVFEAHQQRERQRMAEEGRIIDAYLQRPGAADRQREIMEGHLIQQEAILLNQALEVQALRDHVIEVNGAAPPPPNMDGIPVEPQNALNARRAWDEEDQRQEELRRVQALQNHALEGAPPLPDLIRDIRNIQVPRWRVGLNEPGGGGGVLVTANDEALARMVALPVLRETVVEATECPICMEELGEVGKTVLKCGHTVCVSCFLQQIMRATAANNVNKCECSVCRVNYIM